MNLLSRKTLREIKKYTAENQNKPVSKSKINKEITSSIPTIISINLVTLFLSHKTTSLTTLSNLKKKLVLRKINLKVWANL